MASIELKNITMVYDKGVKALDNISLKAEDHEFLVLLGPSGCGKSTLLRIVAGILEQTEGEVFFDDEDMSKAEPHKRNVSMVFQNYALYPHLNVYKNMEFPLDNIKGLSREEKKERIETVAKMLDIDFILNRRPRELSGGQRQRVALGRAMVREPRVYLFDEPLSNLDVKMRMELRDVIARIHDSLQTTFIYVTHDQSEAMQLADRIAVMDNGVIKQIGAPQDVYNNPNCVYVASFVGSPKMNFFASRFVKKDGNWAVKLMGEEINIPVSRLPLDKEGIEENGKVISGIRPEDFKIDRPEGSDVKEIKATVTKWIPMGSGMHVECSCNGTDFLTVFLNHTNIENGQEITLYVDTKTVHLFDPETELAYCTPVQL